MGVNNLCAHTAAMEKAGLKVSCSKLLQYRDLLKVVWNFNPSIKIYILYLMMQKKIAKVEAVAHKVIDLKVGMKLLHVHPFL